MRRATVAAVVAAIAIAGCGDSDDPAATTRPAPAPTAEETVDHLPKLPREWRRELNPQGGYAFGLPRGWSHRTRGASSLIRSYDHLAAISIVVDRSAAAFEVPLQKFASETAGALPSYPGGLRDLRTRRFRHPYEGVEVRARGTARGGVAQEVAVIALRRDSGATFTAVLAASVKPVAEASLRLARDVVATLRSRPPR